MSQISLSVLFELSVDSYSNLKIWLYAETDEKVNAAIIRRAYLENIIYIIK